MKNIFISLLSFFYFTVNGQVFNGTGGTVLNNGGQETNFYLNVSGLNPSQIDSVFGLEEVCINISHAALQELNVVIVSPSGIQVDLTSALSCSGSDFSGTCFNNSSLNSVTTGSAPYAGAFKPVGNLGRFNTGKPGNGTWKLVVKDFVAPANTGTVVSWSLKFSNTPARPVILKSSNLPLVFINTSQPLSDNDQLVDFGVIDNGSTRNNITDPKNNFNGKAVCHLRGSSSKMFEKKNIKVELKDAAGVNDAMVSLLGMPAESDWILTACYPDKTLMRNALTQYLFSQMGNYSPRTRFVEVILNGEYFGVYTLMEQVKRGNNRVDISKLEPIDNQFPYVTGGYILQINRSDDPGWYSLYPGLSATNAKFYYQYNYPKAELITSQQKSYVKAVLDSFETVMQSPSFSNSVTGYKKYVDENSFIDYFIINELSKNPDAYKLSTYLYKDNIKDGGKFHIGPVWDFDIAWHNCNFGDAFLEQYWQHLIPNDSIPIPTWWQKFLQDPAFKDKLYCRYHTLRLNLLSNNKIYEYIDATATLLNESQQRNFRQFPTIGAYIFPNPQNQAGATYLGEVNDLKVWVSKRAAWMDTNIPGYCSNVSVTANSLTEKDLNIYPNPFSNSVRVELYSQESANIRFDLYTLIGDKVLSVTADNKVQGEYSRELNTEGLVAGTYILKVSVNNILHYKKIIKL